MSGKPVRRTNISYGTIAAAMSGMKEDNSYLTLDKMREYDDREYDFREGEINDDMVRLREKPGLDSKTKDHLNEGDKVTIVDESSYKEQIGSMNDRWYEVLFADKETEGEAGWGIWSLCECKWKNGLMSADLQVRYRSRL
jgi:hypothetical protein